VTRLITLAAVQPADEAVVRLFRCTWSAVPTRARKVTGARLLKPPLLRSWFWINTLLAGCMPWMAVLLLGLSCFGNCKRIGQPLTDRKGSLVDGA